MQSIDLYGDGIGKVELVDHMGTDLTIVNAARVSYGKHKTEFDDGDRKLIRYLMKNRHTSPLEQVSFSLRFIVPLFVRSQHHRHRTWCLSGDTNVTFNKPSRWKQGVHTGRTTTLKRLYRSWSKNDSNKDRIRKRFIRVYDECNKRFTSSHIENVIFSGQKPVYRITLEDNYSVTCTLDHRILTVNGWKSVEGALGLISLEDGSLLISKECYILTNGSHQPWKDKNWLLDAKRRLLTPLQMAKEAGCSRITIWRWLAKYDIKYERHECSKRWRENNPSPLLGRKFPNRKYTPWAPEKREAFIKRRSGENNNLWKGGISTFRAKVTAWNKNQKRRLKEKFNNSCSHCGKTDCKFNVHHKVPIGVDPTLAFDFENLELLCVPCHYEAHRQLGDQGKHLIGVGKPLKAIPKKVLKIEYVGMEDTYDLTIAGEHHNFVGNGIIVHNCYSEISRRYTSDDIAFYYPQQWRKQAKVNKQASEEPFDAPHVDKKVRDYCLQGYNLYLDLQENDEVAREMARMILPQNLYTQYYGTVNLHNALHFLGLRLHPHAQWEIQRVAWAMKEIMKGLYPETMKIWEELNA